MLNFEDLYNSYSSEVYKFAFWISGDRFEAEDITSETFVRVWVRFNSIQTKTLKAYLFTIARNIYLKKWNQAKRHIAIDDTFPYPIPGPEKIVVSRLEIQQIQNMLQMLSEIDRTAFILRVLFDLPYIEIARILQISNSSVKVKVHRVRKKLLASRIDLEVD